MQAFTGGPRHVKLSGRCSLSIIPKDQKAQTKIDVLWLASDHIHLDIDASPAYALDDTVHAIREHLEHAMTHLFPELQYSNQPCWEQEYFAEGIG